jgi:hypothetical protein
MKALKRETTMPKRFPEALSLPSIALPGKSERQFSDGISLWFFCVARWLRVEQYIIRDYRR